MFEFTCRRCGLVQRQEQRVGPRGEPLFGGDARQLAKLARYQDGTRTDGTPGYGMQGHGQRGACPRCTKRMRDELWPLPKES